MEFKNYSASVFTFCFILILTKTCFSQLTVEAGKDTTYCVGQYPDTMYLGSNLNIENGVDPYSVRWESNYKVSPQLVFTASDFLNDTTIASPYFTSWLTETEPEKIKFIVSVTDGLGNFVQDSINVSFSGCGCPAGTIVVEINKGDSVWLDAGLPSGKYEKIFWIPEYGLTNPDSSATWCKPYSSMHYYTVSVDSFGCECTCPIYEIRVYDPVSFFVEPNARWSVVRTFANGNPQNPDFVEINTTLFGYAGDTIIDNKNWLKIHSSPDPEFKTNLNHLGYINHEGSKILFMEEPGETDTLYDFDLMVGDSVKYEFSFGTEYLKIKQVDSIQFAGRYFKRILFEEPSYQPGYLNEVWIEKIGSIHGPLFPTYPKLFSREIPDSTLLSCFKIPPYLIWLNDTFNECYISVTSAANKKLFNEIDIYPNPATKHFTVSIPFNYMIKTIEMTELSGRLIKTWKNVKPGENTFQIETVLPGIYLLKVETKFGTITKKLIIQ